MVSTKHLLDHIEALLRLSHDAKDRAISAKIRELADELRIMISVADVTDWAATLSSAPSVAVPVSNEIITALYGTKPKRRRRANESASDESSPKPKRRAKKRVEK
jgi:G:T/U-mismatch repair DNA glycosylase